jgi:AcrR family transcriptional regulator
MTGILKKQDQSVKALNRAERLREASKQRRTQEKQEVRQSILQVSTELFLEYGYEHFSLRQVAERIGYSPGTIYLYFRDKDAVLFTILNEGITRFGQVLAEAASVSDPGERLTRIGRAYVEFGLTNPVYFKLMFMQRADYLRRPDTAIPEPLIAIFDLWRTAVEDAMKVGLLRLGDPVSTGDAFWALLHGVVSIAILMPEFDKKRVNEMIETALEMMSKGLHRL